MGTSMTRASVQAERVRARRRTTKAATQDATSTSVHAAFAAASGAQANGTRRSALGGGWGTKEPSSATPSRAASATNHERSYARSSGRPSTTARAGT